ncbi:MAG TPA: UDP-galactose-lipid carrier transferase [Polyangia bacterium]|jgi:polyphosphate kinase 2 (PPK2 family)
MGILDKLDYDAAVADKKQYEKELADLQLAILKAELKTREGGRPVIVAFEGWDAAGKGGAIKRMTEKLDPRGYQVHAIAAPTEDEKKHHYLWRFWTRMPERGRWGVFDRTWYGRVLVERVEGFCKKKAWKRAYREINEFERALVDDGAVLVKVFLAITKPEQKRRFEERENDPYKRWKIGPEDWRNREHWDEYVDAAEQMFDETNSAWAPWKVIGGNKKWHARLEVLRHLVARLDAAFTDDDD